MGLHKKAYNFSKLLNNFNLPTNLFDSHLVDDGLPLPLHLNHILHLPDKKYFCLPEKICETLLPNYNHEPLRPQEGGGT